MSIKKILIKTIIPLFLVGLMALYLLWNTVPTRISKTLSEALKTTVFIGNARFSPNVINFDKISINSIKNSKLPQAFTCENLGLHNFFTNYFHSDIEIDLIELNDVYLGLEFDSPNSATGNWSRLMDNLQNSTTNRTSKSSKSVTIKKLVIKNIKCQIVYLDRNSKPIDLKTIPYLEFTDISSSEGFPIEQLSNSVLGKMLKKVFVDQNLKDMLGDWTQPKQQIQKLIKPFKLF
jgi:hypothetical protein